MAMTPIERDMEDFAEISDAQRMTDIAGRYQKSGWVFLPGFLPKSWMPLMVRDALTAPSRRVTVGTSEERWTEHAITEECFLGRFLGSRCVIELARRALERPMSASPKIWAQSYVAGERIDWHCDSTGDVQLLLCLEAPSAEFGGEFCMRVNGDEVRIVLQPTDALLFSANTISHSTTRLVAAVGRPHPQRITAVARMFRAERAPLA
jgi:hypothetical protein